MRRSILKFDVKFAFDTVKHFIGIRMRMEFQCSVFGLKNAAHMVI